MFYLLTYLFSLSLAALDTPGPEDLEDGVSVFFKLFLLSLDQNFDSGVVLIYGRIICCI